MVIKAFDRPARIHLVDFANIVEIEPILEEIVKDENVSTYLPIETPKQESYIKAVIFESLESDKTSGGMKNGVVYGINFEELFCRARAFSRGEFMPRFTNEKIYRFDSARFVQNGSKFTDITIETNHFIFKADQLDSTKRNAEIVMTKLFRNSCKLDSSFVGIILPLKCEIKSDKLTCALDLKKLIDNLSGVEAKATKIEEKKEIRKLKEEIIEKREELIKIISETDEEKKDLIDLKELKKEFQKRKIKREQMEEHDLRELFAP